MNIIVSPWALESKAIFLTPSKRRVYGAVKQSIFDALKVGAEFTMCDGTMTDVYEIRHNRKIFGTAIVKEVQEVYVFNGASGALYSKPEMKDEYKLSPELVKIGGYENYDRFYSAQIEFGVGYSHYPRLFKLVQFEITHRTDYVRPIVILD